MWECGGAAVAIHVRPNPNIPSMSFYFRMESYMDCPRLKKGFEICFLIGLLEIVSLVVVLTLKTTIVILNGKSLYAEEVK